MMQLVPPATRNSLTTKTLGVQRVAIALSVLVAVRTGAPTMSVIIDGVPVQVSKVPCVN